MFMRQSVFTSSTSAMEALVWVPSSGPTPTRTLLYLHGAGGFGSGLAGLFEHPDLPSLLRDGLEIDARVVIPSCHLGTQWELAVLCRFLEDLEAAHGRPSQGYDVVGYSRGGRGALAFAAAHPERVRSVASIAGPEVTELLARLTHRPLLFCHGLSDPKTPAAQVRRMHEAVLAQGGNSHLMLVEGDHFIVADLFRAGRIFAWHRSLQEAL